MSNKLPVDGFLLEQIDSIPHLEALLLLWNSRPRLWTAEDVGKALFLKTDAARLILADLVRKKLISVSREQPEAFWYEQEAERDMILTAVDSAYRTDLIRVTRLIHSKPSAAVRAFAQAFRLKKDRD